MNSKVNTYQLQICLLIAFVIGFVGTFDKVLGTGPFENTTQKERLEEIQRYSDERNRKPIDTGIAQAGDTIEIEGEYILTLPENMTAKSIFVEPFGRSIWEIYRPGDLTPFATSISLYPGIELTESAFRFTATTVLTFRGLDIIDIGCNEFFDFENVEFCYESFSEDLPDFTSYAHLITLSKGNAPPLQVIFGHIGQWEPDDIADIKTVVEALQEA